MTARDHFAAANHTQPRNGTPAQGSVRGECTEWRLTDAEREAVEATVEILEAGEVPKILRPHLTNTLRGLLERTGAANSGEDRRGGGGE